ncbi:MAG TPA: Do family serine endopeptidase [Candidatus Sulfotelmatobacter sp.]|nr:Do family serine endopeptidase [Candidatus Sulfotelmatobacter sp.]
MKTPSWPIHPRSYVVVAALLVLVGVAAGLGLSAGLDLSHGTAANHGSVFAVPASAAAPSASAALPESPFVGVVDKALPAVVFIDVRKKVGGGDSDDPQEQLFRRFFGEDSPRKPTYRPSSGSGFIIDSQGRILTNNHVVRDADQITVTLNDKRQFKARVLGADPETDVAVIKIDADNLPVLPLGDSDNLRVGDWAIAIGNPLGELKGSVTVGIISAEGRSNLNIFGGTPAFQDFIQTDASINFGNSGGPLCNIRGEAIGINTAINPSGQGIGFAIPINLARHVAEQLVAKGSVSRAWLGVQLAELTPELAEGFGIKGDQGVVIQDVVPGQPAERAGLKRNDVIVEFQGQPVTDLQKFRLKVADTAVGSKVNLVVLRDGKKVPVSVTLSQRDQNVLASNQGSPDDKNAPESPASAAGLKVRDMSRSELSAAKLDAGVIITDVEDSSPADEAGLQPGDVIEEVGGKSVASSEDFSKAIASAKKSGKRHAVLLVRRGDSSQFVPLQIQE